MRNNEKKEESIFGKGIIVVGYVGFILAWWMGVLRVDIFNDVVLIFSIMGAILFVDSVVCIFRKLNSGHADYMSEEEIAERAKRRSVVNWIRFAIVTIIAGYIAYSFIVTFVMRGNFEKAMYVFVGFLVVVIGYIDRKIRGKLSKKQHKLCVAGMVAVAGIVLVIGAKNIVNLLYDDGNLKVDFKEEMKYYISTEDMKSEQEHDYLNYRLKESILADEFYSYVDFTKGRDVMMVNYIDLRSEFLVPLYINTSLSGARRSVDDLKEYETGKEYKIQYTKGVYDNIAFVTIGDQVLFIRWSFGEIEDGVKAIDERMGELVD